MKIVVKCAKCFENLAEKTIDVSKAPLPVNAAEILISVKPHKCKKD